MPCFPADQEDGVQECAGVDGGDRVRGGARQDAGPRRRAAGVRPFPRHALRRAAQLHRAAAPRTEHRQEDREGHRTQRDRTVRQPTSPGGVT